MTTPTDTPKATPKAMTLPELRKFDGQLFIMNTTPMKITFRENLGDKSVDFELDPAGEPDSISFLPKLALDMRGLQKLWMRGSVIISTDPEMEEQIMLLNAKSVGASQERMNEILGLQTENANTKDIIEKACLVCGQVNKQTSVIERGRVMQSRREDKEGVPPLCTEHQEEAHRYVPRLVSDKGEDRWEFDTVQLGKTQR